MNNSQDTTTTTNEWNCTTERCITLHLQPLYRLDSPLYQLPDTVSYLLHELTTGCLWFVLCVDRKHREIPDSALNGQCLLQSSPYQCCDALHIASHDRLAFQAIVKMEWFLTNYEAPPCKKGKTAKTESTSKQESSKIYESTQRKRT